MSHTNSNPYQGFSHPSVPGYNQPFNQCGCGGPDACGTEHQAAIKMATVTRMSATGQREQVTQTVPLGHFYATAPHNAFAIWDGNLALNDLYKSKQKHYMPPALPYVCDRPMSGAAMCNMGNMNSNCDP
jgi:hypothetical protein